MSLCRHYVRELRRSVLISTPDLEKGGSKRSSQVLDNYNAERHSSDQGPSGTTRSLNGMQKERMSNDQRLSAFLRHDTETRHSPQNSTASAKSEGNTPGSEAPPRPSFMTGTGTGTPSPLNNSNGSPQHTVARTDIRNSAEKILYTYLLPGAEREIILPQGILNEITKAIEQEGRDDPEVFDAAKDYVFQAMERDAFPGFLRAKALGNIVQPSMLLRLILGLVSLFTAFWTAFVLIFLDKPRSTRCWVIWPFTFGVYFLASHQYLLDPILALAGYSEYTFFSVHRIKEGFVGDYEYVWCGWAQKALWRYGQGNEASYGEASLRKDCWSADVIGILGDDVMATYVRVLGSGEFNTNAKVHLLCAESLAAVNVHALAKDVRRERLILGTSCSIKGILVA
ncbi:Bud site selection protein, Revert to axial protein 1 [Teratosphaeriaceae sp. CCFEE 6253]|nr:Bud site selection protein, Revert to axial protein 1 [Teratosphaeriaceae sp. CCFEE 6253]